METVHSINLIVSNPKVRSGRPCIAGTGLRVLDIAIAMLFHDRSVDELASDYGVTLAQVHAALAYYYEHKTEIDADIRHEIDVMRQAKEAWLADPNTHPLLPR